MFIGSTRSIQEVLLLCLSWMTASGAVCASISAPNDSSCDDHWIYVIELNLGQPNVHQNLTSWVLVRHQNSDFQIPTLSSMIK